MRARPRFCDAPTNGLGITIANRYPLWILTLVQIDNAPRRRAGRSARGLDRLLIGAGLAHDGRAASGLHGDSQRQRLDPRPFELGRGDGDHAAAGVHHGAAAVAGADWGGELDIVAAL